MRTYSAIGVLLLVCGHGFAQNALDKPLDRNMRVGGGQINPSRPDLAQELRLRNAIVTGNVPGGVSFRGDVGYAAPGEFFGALGSNETFSFRRDSFYSGLGGLGIRGTDALQYQFAMTTGNAPPPGFLGVPIVSRSGSASPVRTAPVQGEKITPESALRRVERPDDLRGLALTSLRSPSAFAASRSLEPMVLGRQSLGDNRMIGVSASPLLGLSATEQESARPGSPAKATEQLNAQPGQPLNVQDNKQETKLETGPQKSPYDELMDRIKRTTDKDGAVEPEGGDKSLPTWQERLDELRKQLGTSPTGAERRPRPALPGQPGAMPETPPAAPDPNTIDRIREAGGDIQELAAKGFDAYGAHMEAAQDHLAAGRFFFAEERFTAALSIKAGDPMAAIGRVHAQLGAGMLLSAAINLRSLFAEHPEVVALKYEASLLPAPDRIAALQERLAELVAKRDGKQRDLGLLIAYLGYQSGDAKHVTAGLALMAEPPVTAPDEPAPEQPDQLQKLSGVLKRAWQPPAKPDAAAPDQPK